VATQRNVSEMWRHFRNMTLPDSLKSKINCWLQRGYIQAYEYGVFLPPSWVSVMLGQNLSPRSYDPRVNNIEFSELQRIAKGMQMNVENAVQSAPEHKQFIMRYGAASLNGELKVVL
jgi:tryptophan halogenase